MTLSTSDNVARYAAAVDQTVFAYGFRVDDADHLQVYVDSVLQSGGYAASGIGSDAGGNVTFTTAPRQTGEAAKTVTLLRKVPLTQTTDLPTQGALPTEAIEDELDRLVMRTQQLDEVDARSFKVPVESTVGGSALELTPEASKLIGWNAGATTLANYASSTLVAGILPTAFMQTLLGDSNAAEALATLGISMAPVDVTVDNSAYPAVGEITLTAGARHYIVDSAASGSGANDCGKINAAAGMTDGTIITLRKKDAADPTFLSHEDTEGNVHNVGDRIAYLDTHHAVRYMLIGADWYELRGKGLVGVQGFGTAGANTWTRPDGVTHVLVTAIGGGGGGGGLASGANYRTSGSGSCGGQVVGFYDISDQTSVTVTIGAGGAGASAGLNAGGNGGSTTFGSYCTGGGGNGGGGAGSSTAPYVGGGNATGGNIKNIAGAPGLTGYVCLTGSGPGYEVHACKPIPGWPFGPGGVQTTNPSGSATVDVSNNWPGQGGAWESGDSLRYVGLCRARRCRRLLHRLGVLGVNQHRAVDEASCQQNPCWPTPPH